MSSIHKIWLDFLAHEAFSVENGMNFTLVNRELADSIRRHAMAGKFSVKACATNCVKYNGCTGFTYVSIATKCVLTVSNLTTTEQGAVETRFDSLTYSLTRKEDIVPSYANIAQGEVIITFWPWHFWVFRHSFKEKAQWLCCLHACVAEISSKFC